MTDEGQIDAELAEIEQLRAKVNELSEAERKHLKTIGDQGNQIGDLRQVVHQQYEQLQGSNESDWDYDPTEKEIKSIKSELNSLKTEEALRKLESDFPGFRDTTQSQNFKDWVQESQTRRNLYDRGNNMDFGSARELLSLWQEREKMKDELQVQGNTKRREALRNASMEKGSAGGAKQMYYDRSELIRMRTERPDEWANKWPDIQRAYAEGRVR